MYIDLLKILPPVWLHGYKECGTFQRFANQIVRPGTRFNSIPSRCDSRSVRHFRRFTEIPASKEKK